jgi:predicted  nucleic acid-binding Zn-ribbon protein
MLKELPLLYDLQQVDTEIGLLEEKKAGLEDGSELQADIATLRARLEVAQARLRQLEAEQNDRRLQVDSLEKKRIAEEKRMYAGKGMSAKEVQALQMEIENLKDRRETLELEVMDLDDQISPLREEVEDLGPKIEAMEAELADVRERYQAVAVGIDADIARLMVTRNERAAKVSPPVQRRYDSIRERASNLAIVLVTDNVCPGCHTQLTHFILRQLQEKKKVQYCENCQRLLYWEGEARRALTAEDLGIDLSEEDEMGTASDFRRGRTRIHRDFKDGKMPTG